MLRLYNALTKRKEEFKPIEKGKVRMYNCGPTVYFYAHIGNLRSFTFADILRRYLEYRGFEVKQVMNITDVGHMTAEALDAESGTDKMEEAVKRENKDPWEIASFYTKTFLEDCKKMNFKEPFKRPKATDSIYDMLKIIEKLIERGYAYVVNGCVYYDVTKFSDYGKLSGNTIEKLKEGAGGRVESNPDKKNHFDFALWIEDPKHIMYWKSPWGAHGYPGWHIECSVMAMKYLGETIDIHTGGEDNKFPHHECEIAQSEGATGKRFCNYWLHVKHLLVDGEKMSKSKGNFYTLRDLTERGYSPKALRFYYFSSHYRSQMNFTLDGLKQAGETLKKLWDFLDRLKEWEGGGETPKVDELIEEVKKGFEKEMDDDLNTPGSLAVMFDFVRKINKLMEKGDIGKENCLAVHDAMTEFDKVLGVLEREKKNETRKGAIKLKDKVKSILYRGIEPSEELKKLIGERENQRKNRNFKEADKIREKIKKMGYVIEDGDTMIVKKKS